jgi:hypothetical protein
VMYGLLMCGTLGVQFHDIYRHMVIQHGACVATLETAVSLCIKDSGNILTKEGEARGNGKFIVRTP